MLHQGIHSVAPGGVLYSATIPEQVQGLHSVAPGGVLYSATIPEQVQGLHSLVIHGVAQREVTWCCIRGVLYSTWCSIIGGYMM